MMGLVNLVGRVLLVLVFIVSGAVKLWDIDAAADDIKTAVTIPMQIAPYIDKAAALTPFKVPQLLAIVSGLVELVCGIMIVFNLGTCFFGVILILFTIVVTFYVHNFWVPISSERLARATATGAANVEYLNNLVHALKNLSLIGALLLLVSQPKPVLSDEPAYEHDIMRH